MMDEAAVAVVATDPSVVSVLANASDGELEGNRRRALDGSSVEWISAGILGLKMFPAVLDSLRPYLHTVTIITVGDVTIHNPSPRQVEDLLAERPASDPNGR